MFTSIERIFTEFTQVPTYHLLLEAFLFLWISWLLYRRYRSRKVQKSKEIRLTKEEEEELLAEWHPEPLVPPYDPDHPALHVPVMSGKVLQSNPFKMFTTNLQSWNFMKQK